MTRMHGSQVRAYLGNRDASGDITTIEPTLEISVHDATTLGSAGWMESDAGMPGWSAKFSAFYDPAAGGIGRQLEVPGTVFEGLSLVDGDANAIGDVAIVLGQTLLTGAPRVINVADLIRVNGELKGNGKAGVYGFLLHVLGEETISGERTSLDNGASSANGGRFNLHVTAVTGTWTIKVDESSDDGAGDAFAAKVTFTQVVAATETTHSQTVEVSGTIERYLRVSFVEDVAGSITFAVTGARY